MWLVLHAKEQQEKAAGGKRQLETDMQWTITDLVYVAIPGVAAVKVGICFDN